MKVIGTIFGECLNFKSGLRILIWPLEVPFFLSENGHFWPKVTKKKWHFGLTGFRKLIVNSVAEVGSLSARAKITIKNV